MDEEVIVHYGTPRHSGRYPWGSGNDPAQRNKNFLNYVSNLEKKGLSPVEVAKGCGMNTQQLRAKKSIAKMELRKADTALALSLRNQGMSNVAGGKQMGINESTFRSLLDPSIKARNEITNITANMLKDSVKERGLIDVGVGSELYLGVSRTKLKTSIALLEEEGYKTYNIEVPQLGTGGNKKTTIMVLAPPGTEYKDIYKRQADIKMVIDKHSEDGGKTFFPIEYPKSISSDRLKIRYTEDGGSDKDGVIELRRGVEDISLGQSRYAQVRIAVDGTHYLKGMAMYSDDLPAGTDILFNTNKHKDTPKMDVLKPLKTVSKTDLTIDPDNPFGATIKAITGQRHYEDSKGNTQLSVINKVNEEGDWGKWSKNISSQVLSKQPVALAKRQLGLTYSIKKDEFDEICSLTNPAIKKKLLDSFADDCDSSAVHLKAAAMPRQAIHVFLPITDMKDTEVYAPNYRPGEPVVLIRYPHGGTFEIPSLTVNNNHPTAKKLLGNAIDAIGISPNTAKKLSGADFDGDFGLVIPNPGGNTIKTSASLKGLQDFEPKESYPAFEGMPKMTPKTKGMEMGKISNLITDMTIAGAPMDEVCRAVKHSMVVIDAEKHNLDYKKSFTDNGIAQLKQKYQDVNGGASTIISRASSDYRVGVRKDKRVSDMTPSELVDHNAGKKVYEYTNETYIKTSKLKDGTIKETPILKKIPSTKMAEATNAFELSSGLPMESVYATHANKLKALANSARKASLSTKPIEYSASANKVYSKEVSVLKSKLNIALKNAPLERQAQLLANSAIQAKKTSNPDMDASDLKKIKGQELAKARIRIGADKVRVDITDKEWEAIQAGAVSNNTLLKILANTNLDTIKTLATPRSKTITGLTPSKESRIKSMLDAGHSQRDIADALGVTISQVNDLT